MFQPIFFQGKVLRKYCPLKYAHPNSNKKPIAANIIIQKPEPLQETVNAEFVEYLDKVQKNYLEKEVSESVKNKEEYFKDLRLAYDVNADLEIREAAIARLEMEAIRHGVWVGSGDLLTMKMFYVAVSLRFVLILSITSLYARARPIIGFTDLFSRYRLIGIDIHHICISIIGIGIG